MKTLTLSSNYSYTSGYGIILDSLLRKLPYNIIPRSYGPISSRFDEYFDKNFKYSSEYLDLTLLSISNDIDVLNPLLHLSFDRRRILYTMWESTRVNDLIIEILNKFKCVVVPNEYNKINFINQGLNVPIKVVNLFCDTDTFVYKKPETRSKFVFGISNEDPRKNIDKVTCCFLKAFKNIKNVELQVKTCGDIKYKNIDSRIVYTTNKLSKADLLSWYYNLDVYVSGATCEGWGMMQQESMCCGRPLIFTDYAGLSEFVNYNNGFEVGYTEVFSTKQWGGFCGKWSEFNEEELVDKMIYCYSNKLEVQERGYLSSLDAKKFTVDKFINNLTDVIDLYI